MPRAIKAGARTAKPAAKAARSSTTKKAAAKTMKKAAAKKAAPAKKAPAKKAAVKKAAPAKKAAVKKAAPAKKAPAKKAAKAAPVKTTARAAATAPAKPPPAKKAPRKPLFDAKFLEAQRELLLEERATYLRQAATLQAEADALVADFEPGDVQFDEESGEGDTLAVERERDLALSAQARAAVEEIDHALAKLDDGTYGVCEVSGQAIPKERLKAIPWARERVEYKAAGLSRR